MGVPRTAGAVETDRVPPSASVTASSGSTTGPQFLAQAILVLRSFAPTTTIGALGQLMHSRSDLVEVGYGCLARSGSEWVRSSRVQTHEVLERRALQVASDSARDPSGDLGSRTTAHCWRWPASGSSCRCGSAGVRTPLSRVCDAEAGGTHRPCWSDELRAPCCQRFSSGAAWTPCAIPSQRPPPPAPPLRA